MPRFPGCEGKGLKYRELKDCANTAMAMYISKLLKYPSEAREDGIHGKAIIQFVVQKNGKLKDIKVIHDTGAGCGEAAKRVIEQMAEETTWIPRKERGRAVSVMINLPEDFSP